MNHIMKTIGAFAHVGELVTEGTQEFSTVNVGGHNFRDAESLLTYLQDEFAREFERLDTK